LKALKTYITLLFIVSNNFSFSQSNDSLSFLNSKYEKLDKNEISLMWTTLRRDYVFRFPQYGIGYARSISKKNKIWLFANHFRKDVVFSDYVRKTRLYEIGVEYRLRLTKQRPFYFTPSLAYMNTNWDYYNYFRDGSKFIKNEKFHLANLSLGLLYGKTIKIGIFHDLGYGYSSTLYRGFNKQNELILSDSGFGYDNAVSKEFYIRIVYNF